MVRDTVKHSGGVYSTFTMKNYTVKVNNHSNLAVFTKPWCVSIESYEGDFIMFSRWGATRREAFCELGRLRRQLKKMFS